MAVQELAIPTRGHEQEVTKLAGCAMSPRNLGDVMRHGSHLRMRVERRTSQRRMLHQWQVGPVVAHDSHLVPRQAQFPQELVGRLPFVMSAKGQMYLTYFLNPDQLGFKSGPIPDDKSLKGSTVLLTDYVKEHLEKARISLKKKHNPNSVFGDLFACDDLIERDPYIESVISRHITLGDVCVKGWNDVNAKEIEDSVEALQQEMGLVQWDNFDAKTKKYPSALDGLSYVLLMNHNVELHIRGCQEACYWMSQPRNIARQHLPSDVLEFQDMCEEVFTTESPFSLIKKHWTLLEKATGMDASTQIGIDINSF